MNTEKLEKSNQLDYLIKSLETNLNYWSTAIDFNDQLRLKIRRSNGQTGIEYVTNEYMDFNLIKALTISQIEAKLKVAKEEFDSL